MIYKNDVFVTTNFGISFLGSKSLAFSRFFIPALPCLRRVRTNCFEVFANRWFRTRKTTGSQESLFWKYALLFARKSASWLAQFGSIFFNFLSAWATCPWVLWLVRVSFYLVVFYLCSVYFEPNLSWWSDDGGSISHNKLWGDPFTMPKKHKTRKIFIRFLVYVWLNWSIQPYKKADFSISLSNLSYI